QLGSYGKYIKIRMLSLVLVALVIPDTRKFQNYVLVTRNVNRENHTTRVNLITQSSYGGQMILGESKTTTLTSNLRIISPFCQKKQYQVNAMISTYGLP